MNYFVLAVIKWQYDLIVGVLDCEFRVLSWTDIESHLMYRKVDCIVENELKIDMTLVTD